MIVILCVQYALLDYRDRARWLPSKCDYCKVEGFVALLCSSMIHIAPCELKNVTLPKPNVFAIMAHI